MKLKILLLVMNSYIDKTEILRLGKDITKVVRLEPVSGIEPPTKIGLIVIDPKGKETKVRFTKVPQYWKGTGYSWKLDIEWFKREYNKITPENVLQKFKKFGSQL